MHAFIGTVPFTIIEATNFVITNNLKDADLYLVKVFQGAQEVGERLRETGIFQNVYIVDDVLLTYPITLKKCFNVVKNGRTIINLLKTKKYNYCYYNNSGWLINSIFYTGFLKGNPHIKNMFIEHGYSTYIKDYAKRPWYLGFLIRLAGLKCMDGSMLDTVYVYEPELVQSRHNGKLVQMEKLNKKNPKLVNALNKAFAYGKKENPYIEKDIIIMEQGEQKVAFDKEAFWEKVFKTIDLDRAIIKAHPRQKESTLTKCGAAISSNHAIPWEMEILNNDITEKVQLTIFSGSCISPKLMFNDEPTVIFLYKLLPVDYTFLGNEILAFADKIGEKYLNKDKYFIPENLEQLKTYCIQHGLSKENRT